MSLGVGKVARASSSSDVLRESLLEDMGMASIWSSIPPKEGSTSSGETSKPVSFSPTGAHKRSLHDMKNCSPLRNIQLKNLGLSLGAITLAIFW